MEASLVSNGSIFDGIDFSDYYDGNTGVPSFDSAPCKPSWRINKYLVLVIYSLVFILNIIGNSLVVLVIYCNKLKRSTTDVYLLNLAIADLLFAVTLPFWGSYRVTEWIFGTFMCKAISILQEVNFYSGILLLACISVDRYVAIVHATETINRRRHWVKFICLGVWLFSFAISLPTILFRTVYVAPQIGKVCYENIGHENTEQWMIYMRIGRHLIGFFIPLLVMLFCYGLTITTLLQTKSNQKHKAMRIIFAVVLVFLVCWLPYNITVILDSLMRSGLITEKCDLRNHLDVALSVTEVFGYTHSCINPILYAFIGQKFRHSLMRILANKGLLNKELMSRYARSSSVMSTSGNTSTTL
ncbi:C-X-C chemokine receptor type 2-like [Spea bombifrons]|uniref:C-X-C chemokine receptor type 2-like n=1 Tax=Spea bombifrons TaxID=233779 RepID=UPI00234A23D6|nr:C-X-C chemokine receptor type 2-like [Spea bombifrons]